MNLSDAQLVGQAYTDDKTGATFWMHPSIPMGYFVYREHFEAQGLNPTDPIIDLFITVDTFILAIESERDDLSLVRYLDMSVGKTTGERYELFLALVNSEYLQIIGDAYRATRKNEFPLDISPEIAGDDRLKKSTSTSSSKAKSKPSKTQKTSETNVTKSTIQVAAS